MSELKCPKCGQSEDGFNVEGTVAIRIDKEETEIEIFDEDGHAWGDSSYCECRHCDHAAKVNDFRKRGSK